MKCSPSYSDSDQRTSLPPNQISRGNCHQPIKAKTTLSQSENGKPYSQSTQKQLSPANSSKENLDQPIIAKKTLKITLTGQNSRYTANRSEKSLHKPFRANKSYSQSE